MSDNIVFFCFNNAARHFGFFLQIYLSSVKLGTQISVDKNVLKYLKLY